MKPADLYRLLLLFAALLLGAGCDAEVTIKGKAYRWIDPPPGAMSRVIVNRPGATLPPKLESLGDVAVTLDRNAAQSHRRAKYRGIQVLSASDGSFDEGTVVGPGEYDMVIGAMRLGCDAAVQTFRYQHLSPDYDVTVVLVCPHGVPKIPPRPCSPVVGNCRGPVDC